MVPTNSRVVVTGGAGFIGSHLVDVLLEAGNEVIVVDDFSSGSRANLAPHERARALHIEEASVLDEQAMRTLCRDASYVLHLATRDVRLSLRQPTLVHEVNTTGTLNVLKAAAAAKVHRLLYCSSSEVNGTADVVPMPEEYHFKPLTIYGASKLAGEYYAQVFHRAGWLRTVIARPHNNYGPREPYEGTRGELIPRFILWGLAHKPLQVFGDGAQTRDFTYVTETARILAELVACDAAEGSTLNVCRGEEVSVIDIARLVIELTGTAAGIEHRPGRPSDVLRLYGDASKLRAVLGGAPVISIREGLARTLAWFRENVSVTRTLLDSLQGENWLQAQAEDWLRHAARGETP
jgi:UDP-glucose 4-epimerase